jgi:hypothetical protein
MGVQQDELNEYWHYLTPVGRERKHKPHIEDFAAASQAGQPRSVFHVSLEAWQIKPNWENPEMVEHWQSVIRCFRPLLPDDCYPFHAGTREVCFQSLQPQRLAELERIAERVAADPSVRPDGSDDPIAVYACFADDECDWLRASLINNDAAQEQCRAVKAGRSRRTPVVRSTRHTGQARWTRSRLGFVEYDLPEARRRSERQTLAVIGPSGAGWQASQNQHWVAYYATFHLDLWAEEQQAVVIEIDPHDTSVRGLLLGAGPEEAAPLVRELTAALHERGYWGLPDDITFERPLFAEPGEIEFRSVLSEIAPSSNGRDELAQLQAQLATAQRA